MCWPGTGEGFTPRQASVQARVVTGALGPPLCDRGQYRLFREEPCKVTGALLAAASGTRASS